MTDFKDQMSTNRKGVFASMAEAPTAAAYGVGPARIGDQDYFSDAMRWLGAGGTQGIKYIAPNATADDIIAVASALSDAGGGIVQLPAVTITTDKTIPLFPGVIYQGCGYKTAQNWMIASGTIVQASGEFPIFSANDTDRVTDDTAQDCIQRSGVRDLAMLGGTYAIKCGGTITLNTSSSQLFNQIAAKTSLSIPAGASVVIRAHYNGTVGFWAVSSAFGSVT